MEAFAGLRTPYKQFPRELSSMCMVMDLFVFATQLIVKPQKHISRLAFEKT